jgi:hypothetical protein
MKRKKRGAQPYAFFHVTGVENVEPILRDGLRGDVGKWAAIRRDNGEKLPAGPLIFVLTTCRERVTDHVAIGQIWIARDIGDYAILRINPRGVTGKLFTDDCAEWWAADFQRVISQQSIDPAYLKLHKVRSLNHPGDQIQRLLGVFGKRKLTVDEWCLACRYVPPQILGQQKQFEESLTDEPNAD